MHIYSTWMWMDNIIMITVIIIININIERKFDKLTYVLYSFMQLHNKLCSTQLYERIRCTNFLSMPIYIYTCENTFIIIIINVMAQNTFNYLSIYLSICLFGHFFRFWMMYHSYLMILFLVLIHIRHHLLDLYNVIVLSNSVPETFVH